MSAPRPAIDLRDWLTTIDLGAHAASFATNGVDWDVLADLSDAGELPTRVFAPPRAG